MQHDRGGPAEVRGAVAGAGQGVEVLPQPGLVDQVRMSAGSRSARSARPWRPALRRPARWCSARSGPASSAGRRSRGSVRSKLGTPSHSGRPTPKESPCGGRDQCVEPPRPAGRAAAAGSARRRCARAARCRADLVPGQEDARRSADHRWSTSAAVIRAASASCGAGSSPQHPGDPGQRQLRPGPQRVERRVDDHELRLAAQPVVVVVVVAVGQRQPDVARIVVVGGPLALAGVGEVAPGVGRRTGTGRPAPRAAACPRRASCPSRSPTGGRPRPARGRRPYAAPGGSGSGRPGTGTPARRRRSVGHPGRSYIAATATACTGGWMMPEVAIGGCPATRSDCQNDGPGK